MWWGLEGKGVRKASKHREQGSGGHGRRKTIGRTGKREQAAAAGAQDEEQRPWMCCGPALVAEQHACRNLRPPLSSALPPSGRIGPCPPLGPQAQAGRPPPRAPRAESPWSAASPPHPPRPAPPRLRPSCCRPEPPAVARMAVQGADLGVAPPPGAAHNARQAQMVTPDPPVRPSPRSAVRSLRPPSLSALP